MAGKKDAITLCRRIRSYDLREKSSVFFGKKVEYVSGKSFLRVILTHHAGLKPPFEIKFKKDAVRLGDLCGLLRLLEQKLMTRVQKITDPSEPKIVRALAPVSLQTMAEDGFYVWSPEIQNRMWSHAASVLLVIAVIAACCFSVWPLSVKIAIWYVSVYLLAVISALAVVRLVLYIAAFIFGYCFWILPNMFDDKSGLFGGWLPLYSVEKRCDDMSMFAFRMCTLLFLLALGVTYFFRPTVFEEVPLVAAAAVEALLNWGEEKLTGNSTTVSFYRPITDYENMDIS